MLSPTIKVLAVVAAALCSAGHGASVEQASAAQSIADKELLRHNQLRWVREAVNERSKREMPQSKAEEGPTRHTKKMPLVSSGDEALEKIGLALLCASSGDDRSECKNFSPLTSAPVYVLRDEKSHSLYFGYHFIVNYPRLESSKFRNVIFKRAEQAWRAVKEVIEECPGYEQYHVGYFTGGSVAYLVAQRALLWDSRAQRALEHINALNLVKVVTVGELGMFPKSLDFDVVGEQNHMAIQFSDPEQAKSVFKVFGTRLTLLDQNVIPYDRNLSASQLASYSSQPETLPESGNGDFIQAVRNNLSQVQAARSRIAALIRAHALATRKLPYDRCALAIGHNLRSLLFRLRNFRIVCAVKTYSLESHDFQIECYIKLEGEKKAGDKKAGEKKAREEKAREEKAGEELVLFASYAARLTNFDQWMPSCVDIVSRQTKNPNPHANQDWDQCIQDVAPINDALTLLTPYGSKSGESNCRFFANILNRDWATYPMGCVASPELPGSMLDNLYQKVPEVVLSLVQAQSGIPPSCQGIIKPTVMEEAELASFKPQFNTLGAYFKAMSALSPLAPQSQARAVRKLPSNPLPPLFTLQSPVSFTTQKVELSPYRTAINAAAAVKLVECLDQENLTVIKCNLRINQMLRGACPDFCAFPEDSKQAPFCSAMVFCPAANAFIGLTSQAMAMLKWGTPIEATKLLLQQSNVFQYAFWAYKPKYWLLPTITTMYAGVFFLAAPESREGQLETVLNASYGFTDDCLLLQ